MRCALSNILAAAYQVQIFARDTSGSAPVQSVFNVTGPGITISLPWTDEKGAPAQLGQGLAGYPPMLYPNLTITEQQAVGSTVVYSAAYDGFDLGLGTNLVLGPLTINDSFSLLSMTMPVVDNYSETNILGYMTVSIEWL
jgi:osomolarity two-component system, sensor histidine kinase SLN1